ncbi:hypothetical protein TTMY_1165 [Thermus thermophilus]|nr:hypothetical protein TTMY_1165 [Thermus thermophilus]
MAQLGARLNRTQEVTGSSPVGSTRNAPGQSPRGNAFGGTPLLKAPPFRPRWGFRKAFPKTPSKSVVQDGVLWGVPEGLGLVRPPHAGLGRHGGPAKGFLGASRAKGEEGHKGLRPPGAFG